MSDRAFWQSNLARPLGPAFAWVLVVSGCVVPKLDLTRLNETTECTASGMSLAACKAEMTTAAATAAGAPSEQPTAGYSGIAALSCAVPFFCMAAIPSGDAGGDPTSAESSGTGGMPSATTSNEDAGLGVPTTPTADGGSCLASADCQSWVCLNGSCQAPACGDRVCNAAETISTCADDCGTRCGDGAINGDEACDDGNDKPGDGCSDRCEAEAGFRCSMGVNAASMCVDIDACPSAPCARGELCTDIPAPAPDGEAGRACKTVTVCGDGTCADNESLASCAEDCSTCGDGMCTGKETIGTCGSDCAACGDGTCTEPPETAQTCASDCTRCGDKHCTGSETMSDCPSDCSVCGDGRCTGPEDATNCSGDCMSSSSPFGAQGGRT